MPTLEDQFKALGATDDEIKALMGNAKMKAAMERKFADADAALADKVKAETKLKEYDEWYNTQALPTVTNMQTKLTTTEAELAAERARIKALQEAGLLEVAGGAGDDAAAKAAKAAADAAAAAAGKGGVDPEKFVDKSSFLEAFTKTGDAIAEMQDISDEYRDLFGKRLNAKELLAEAREKKTTVRKLYEEKYQVQAKRDEIAKKAEDERIAKIRKEAVDDYISKEANPLTRTPSASAFPSFAAKVDPATGKDAGTLQPWQKPEGGAGDRVAKAMGSLRKEGIL